MKKFAIGCLGLVVIMVVIALVTTMPDTSETTIIQTTPPATVAETKPAITPAKTESPTQTTPPKTETPIPTTPFETKTPTQPPMRIELMAAITGSHASWCNKGDIMKIIELFRWHGKEKEPENSRPFDLSVVWLPEKELEKLDRYYPSSVEAKGVPVLLVCVYNVEQLATEIAKKLKDGTSNG